MCQRDPNHYDFWNEADTQSRVSSTISQFWEEKIKGKWEAADGNCTPSFFWGLLRCRLSDEHLCFTDIFDFLLTRDLNGGHIIDFNPYAPKTDPLLFSYDELLEQLDLSTRNPSFQPKVKVIDSRMHPAASHNAPMHQHNMVPLEALTLSSGRNVQDFAETLADAIRNSTLDGSSDEDEEHTAAAR